jgi:hypothetical protein
MNKWGMRNKVESSGKIEINGISLALRGDQRCKEIKMRYKLLIVDLDFEAMLARI